MKLGNHRTHFGSRIAPHVMHVSFDYFEPELIDDSLQFLDTLLVRSDLSTDISKVCSGFRAGYRPLLISDKNAASRNSPLRTRRKSVIKTPSSSIMWLSGGIDPGDAPPTSA